MMLFRVRSLGGARGHGRGPGDWRVITLADVHAALAYYFDNVDEIQDEFRKDEDAARSAEANLPAQIPPELKAQFGG